ncbi:MAG: hypothetical protein PUB21_10435 [Bacteroidales bacterium]|nr:hypothetical protein [Bacteroidales bacterium]
MAAIALCGCKKKNAPEDTLNSGVIAIAADTCLTPLVEAEIAVFEHIAPQAGIVPIYTGIRNVHTLLLADSVRMVITTHKLLQTELDWLHSKKFFPQEFKIATHPSGFEVYVLLNDPRSGLATGFASFLAGDRGQRIIDKAGYIPVTQPVNTVNIRDNF